MSPQNRDERTKVGSDGRAVVSNRRGSAVTAVLLFLALALVVDGVAGERGWLANRRGQQRLDQAQHGAGRGAAGERRRCATWRSG